MQRKTEKVGYVRVNNIWMNILRTQDGSELFTLTKSYHTKKGWQYSNFFQPDDGDILSIRQALDKWEQSKLVEQSRKSMANAEASHQQAPPQAVE